MQDFISICHETEGRSHKQSKTPCQDKTYSLIESSTAIIALCDGAGSAKYSHFGAENTTRVVAEVLKAKFEDFYSQEELNGVKKEILDSIRSSLENLSKETTKSLKTEANTKIYGILADKQRYLNSLSFNLSFDYNSKLNQAIQQCSHNIQVLEGQKGESESKRNTYLINFEKSLKELWETYEERINLARESHIKILKKKKKHWFKKMSNLDFSFIKDFFSKKGELKIKDFQRAIDTLIKKETEMLGGLLNQIESKLKEIKYKGQEKISDKIESLEHIGDKILNALKEVYKNIKKLMRELRDKLKKHKDELELQSTKAHTHILETQKRFEKIIASFIECYKEARNREQELYSEAIRKRENEKKEKESKLQRHNELKSKLQTACNKCNNETSALKKAIEDLLKREKSKLYELSDVSKLKVQNLEEAIRHVESMRKECLSFISTLGEKEHRLEKQITCDIQSLNTLSQIINESVCDIKDLASTLLFAAIKDEKCIIGHLGDGAIGAMYGDELKCISNPDNGEHANETYFVTTKNAEYKLNVMKGNIKEKNITAFVLMSDGSTEGLYSKKDKTFVSALKKHIDEIKIKGKEKQKDIESLIEKVKNEKSFDDCSIAILALHEPSTESSKKDSKELSKTDTPISQESRGEESIKSKDRESKATTSHTESNKKDSKELPKIEYKATLSQENKEEKMQKNQAISNSKDTSFTNKP